MSLDLQFAKVLCAASVQHLHLQLETLPVGLIVVDKNAAIVAADEWSEELLGFDSKSEKGRSLTNIFGEVAETWSRALSKRETGYLGCLSMVTRTGTNLKLELASAPSVVPHLNDLHIIFSIE